MNRPVVRASMRILLRSFRDHTEKHPRLPPPARRKTVETACFPPSCSSYVVVRLRRSRPACVGLRYPPLEPFLDIALDVLADAIKDVVYIIPFLFVTYLAMKWLEHKTGGKTEAGIQRAGAAGPAIGTIRGRCAAVRVLGSATLWAGRRHHRSARCFAVFLSTSDEMLPIFIAEQVPFEVILKILAAKIVIGMVMGFFVTRACASRGASTRRCTSTSCVSATTATATTTRAASSKAHSDQLHTLQVTLFASSSSSCSTGYSKRWAGGSRAAERERRALRAGLRTGRPHPDLRRERRS